MKKNNKGFSLVELIVVIAIMAILAAVAIPTFAGFIGKANFSADKDFMDQAKYAVELAYAGDHTFNSSAVKVTIAGGKATQIVCGGETIKAAYENGTPGTIGQDAGVTQEQIDAANAIDWDYEFKSVTDNGTYVINTAGSKLESSTP